MQPIRSSICRPKSRTARGGARSNGPQQRRGWLFLTSTEDSRAAALPLQNVWLDCLVRQLLTTDLGATNEQVWIVIDELGALDYQGQLENLVVRGRKRGLCVVLGFQAVSQLHSIYGRDRTVTLLSAPATKLILRSDEAETAEWASRTLGQREVVRLQMTTLTGPSLYRDGFNLQPHQTLERVVLPAEIQKLPRARRLSLHRWLRPRAREDAMGRAQESGCRRLSFVRTILRAVRSSAKRQTRETRAMLASSEAQPGIRRSRGWD